MTSLELQLNRLKTAATQSLAVEKQHLSLLFDRKEAASLDRESYYKLGTVMLDRDLRKSTTIIIKYVFQALLVSPN